MPYFGRINQSGVDEFIPDGTIENKELVNSSITLSGIGISLGDSIAQPAFDLTLATNLKSAALDNNTVNFGGVTLGLGSTDLTPTFDLTNAVNYPTTSLTGVITNAQLAGSISNDKLVNSSVSFGGIQLSLGGSDATPAFVLTDATDYRASELTGTTLNSGVTASSLTSLGTLTSLEVAGQGSFAGTFHSYVFANNAEGLTVKGSESAMDIVGSDGGAHGSSLLLRTGTNGFGFLNSPFNDHFYFRSFTSSGNSFDISGGGNGQISALENILTITKSGDVGIGLANNVDPASKLTVEDNVASGTTNVFIYNKGGDANIYLLNDDQTSAGLGTLTDNGSYIDLSGKWNSSNPAANRTFGRIGAFKENNTSANGAGYLALYSRPDGSGLTERVRITSDGNVGIGITLPDTKLHVRLPDTNTAAIAKFERIDAAVSSQIHYDGSDGSISFETTTNHPLAFGTNNQERTRITSTGKLLHGGAIDSGVTLGTGVAIKSDAVGSAFNTGALALTGTGGDFYGLTFSKALSTSSEGFGFLPIFSTATDRMDFGYNDGTSGNTTLWRSSADGSTEFFGPVTATSFNGTPDSSLSINNQSGSYVLVFGDSSKLIRQTGSGTNITVPASTFTAGKVVSIFNASAGNITIVQAVGVTMYNTADGSTGNRTLAAKGLCTVICTNTDEFTISGGGLV
jgi:hypothetical protein